MRLIGWRPLWRVVGRRSREPFHAITRVRGASRGSWRGAHYHGNAGEMSLPRSRLTAQGQISVPVEIRRKLGLAPGSTLEWEEVGEQMVVRRAGSYSSRDIQRALFPEAPPKRTVEEIKQARADYVRKRHARR